MWTFSKFSQRLSTYPKLVSVSLQIFCTLLLAINQTSGQYQSDGQPRYFQSARNPNNRQYQGQPGPPGRPPSAQVAYNGPQGMNPGGPNPYVGPPGLRPVQQGPPPIMQHIHPTPNLRRKPILQSLKFEYATLSPDNFAQKVITINGQFPGPPIRVKMYDTLIIDVTNGLDHGISINLHGIRNYGEPEADGVPQVTQELIPPGTIFRYMVSIGFQTGTFMYHLHNGLDSIWAVGPLIIEDGPQLLANHEEYYHFWDFTIILQQCYHKPLSEMLRGLEGSPYSDLPEADSILINGMSYGQWNIIKENTTGATGKGYEVLTVRPDKTYRFRVIGFGADTILSFKIAGHTMRIIEVDGIITKPITVDHLQVNSGQRYSVLVTMDQTPGNFLIESEMIPGPGPKNGRAILNYEGIAVPDTMRKEVLQGKTEKVNLTVWETAALAPNEDIQQPDIYLPPTTVDKEIIVKSHLKIQSNGSRKYDVNGEIYKDPKVPYLFQVKNGVNITKEPQVFESLTNKSIQIIFQNIASEDGICEQHPWNLHGHSVYLVGQGPGEYDTKTDGKVINKRVEEHPNTLVFRDVVTLYPELAPELNSNATNTLTKNSSTTSSNSNVTENKTAGPSTTTARTTTTAPTTTTTSTTTPKITVKSNSSSNSDPSASFQSAADSMMESFNSTANTFVNAVSDASNAFSNQSIAIATSYIPKFLGPERPKLPKKGTPCGWVAIRFVTDNPGLWLAHCHLTAHLIMGKEFVLYAHQEENPYLRLHGNA